MDTTTLPRPAGARPAPLPPLFVSHGSPTTALEPGPAGAFWRRLGAAIDATFGRPRAIVAVSAHTMTREPVLLGAPRHDTVHDFGGFPDALYRLRYDAPGAPALAAALATALRDAAFPIHLTDDGGLDHGIWVPLRFMWPDADVPVLPLGTPLHWDAPRLWALGEALRPVLDAHGALLLATGSVTHNLRWVFASRAAGMAPVDAPERAESAAFRAWVADRAAARDWDALLDTRRRAPHAVDVHPTDEHWQPWHVAAGAGGRAHAAPRLHASVTHGALGMDAYAFGPHAATLADALEVAPAAPLAG